GLARDRDAARRDLVRAAPRLVGGVAGHRHEPAVLGREQRHRLDVRSRRGDDPADRARRHRDGRAAGVVAGPPARSDSPAGGYGAGLALRRATRLVVRPAAPAAAGRGRPRGHRRIARAPAVARRSRGHHHGGAVAAVRLRVPAGWGILVCDHAAPLLLPGPGLRCGRSRSRPRPAKPSAANDLGGQVVVITGATGHLGHAVVAALLEGGAHVAAPHRDGSGVEEIRQAFAGAGERLWLEAADLGDETSMARFAESVVRRFGRIDALAALAGGFAAGPVADTNVEAIRALFEQNVVTAYTTIRAVLPHMRARAYGRIV